MVALFAGFVGIIIEADSYARKGMAIEAPGLFQSINNFFSVSTLHSLGQNFSV